MRFLLSVILCCLIALPAQAAIAANTHWEVQPTVGATANGGGFSPGVGTKTVTAAADLTVNASNCKIVTSATHNFVSGDNHKFLIITAGTGWSFSATSAYQIESTSANAATLVSCPTYAGNANLATYDLYDGVDYGYKASCGTPQVNIDNVTITATTAGANSNVMTFNAAYTVAVGDNGNIVNVASGTNINAGSYEITSVTTGAGGTWTVTGVGNLTTAGGAGAAIVAKMGGCRSHLSEPNGVMVAGNTVWVKASGTDSLAGAVTLTNGSSGNMNTFTGYTSTRNDGGAATLQNTTNVTMITGSTFTIFSNFILDANAATAGTSSRCITNAQTTFIGYFLECKNAGTAISAMNLAAGVWERIWSHANGTSTTLFDISFSGAKSCVDCVATDSVRTGMGGNAITCIRCISANHTGSTSDGFQATGAGNMLVNCAFVRNTRDGIRAPSAGNGDALLVFNTIFSRNGGVDFDSVTTSYLNGQILADYNAYDTTGTMITNAPFGPHDIHLTGDPFTSATTGDFSLNNTAGAGAALKNAGYPGLFSNGLTTSHQTVGPWEPTVGASCAVSTCGYVQ